MKSRAGTRTVRAGGISLIVLVAAFSGLQATDATAAPPYPEAVLLVSGFETESPFTTPATACKGQEGSEWNPPGFPVGSTPEGIAPVLRQAGFKVFTAPVTKSTTALPSTCVGSGEPVPVLDPTRKDTVVVKSNGDTHANGAALARLIKFLRNSYGVTDLRIVGHSDGGLWSRAAITQNLEYLGVDIRSLTTLGTPHTGSFMADLAMELNGGKCDFSNRKEQIICDIVVDLARLVVAKLGLKATYQLSNDFLATWNPEQTIGNCPVSAIAGNHVKFPIPLFDYYTPSDGLVGKASAQAKWALDISGHLIPAPVIPDLREAGVYDVVHGGSLSRLYGKTLLNQAQISEQVADSIALDGSSPCNIVPIPPSSDAEPSAGTSGSEQKLRAPLYRMVAADKHGRLPKPGPEDFVVSKKGVSIRCGRTRLSAVPVFGDRRLRIHHPAGCTDGLRAQRNEGEGVARALMLRSNRSRDAFVRVSGDRARIRVRGKAPKTFRAEYLNQGKWKKLKLGGRGWTTLPATNSGSLRLRIRARGKSRSVPADTANLALAR